MFKNRNNRICDAVVIVTLMVLCLSHNSLAQQAFPNDLPESKPDRPLSAAMERFYDQWNGATGEANELFTNFKYTPLTGLDYNNHDGTISRRDPTKVLKIDGKYYVWYTHRETKIPPKGPQGGTETIPSSDWDLSEIWFATSEDGFTWTEQGVAVKRPEKPHAGWRSVSTPDVLVWKGKYYLYYQGFLEMPGTRGDYCPVSASVADSPDGPWRPANKIVVDNGVEGEWDMNNIHDPYPLVYKGKIYLYYKSAFNREQGAKRRLLMAQGLAIADHPFGPFKKHPLNPVLNSGHETGLFPFKEGIAAMAILNGGERTTIQYAPDGVNFEVAAITELMPIAPGPCVPDAFADNGNGRGITWGLSHIPMNTDNRARNAIGAGSHQILARFDCDLSLDFHDRSLKRANVRYWPEVFFSLKMDQGLRKRMEQQLQKEPDTLPTVGQ
jgi:hypothetical protein